MQRKRDVIRPFEDDEDVGDTEEGDEGYYYDGGGEDEGGGVPYEDGDDMDTETSGDEGEGAVIREEYEEEEEEEGEWEGGTDEGEREPLVATPREKARERRKDDRATRRRRRRMATAHREDGKRVTAKEHTLVWGSLSTILVGIVQCILIFDLPLEFVRFDFLGYFYLSFGVALWVAWAVCYGVLAHRTRAMMDPAMMKACGMMVYPMLYVILMVLCFSAIFIRWAHFFGGKTADIEDVDSGAVPFSEALLIKFGETSLVSLLPLTVYVLILLLMRYYELVIAQREAEARGASSVRGYEN
jgi:hypothetical protein